MFPKSINVPTDKLTARILNFDTSWHQRALDVAELEKRIAELEKENAELMQFFLDMKEVVDNGIIPAFKKVVSKES